MYTFVVNIRYTMSEWNWYSTIIGLSISHVGSTVLAQNMTVSCDGM